MCEPGEDDIGKDFVVQLFQDGGVRLKTGRNVYVPLRETGVLAGAIASWIDTVPEVSNTVGVVALKATRLLQGR